MVNQGEIDRNRFSPSWLDFDDSGLEGLGLPTHYGFIDEVGLNKGRHRAIAMVSLEVASAYGIVRETCLRVQKHWPSEKEMHWVEVRDDGKSRAAAQMVSVISALAERSFIRVDVLHWDTHDRYHSVCGRDDRENANAMASHLLNQVCGRRWPYSQRWAIYPDNGSIIDWMSCTERITSKAIEIREVTSDQDVLVQVADLFAGLTAFAADRLNRLLASKARGTHLSNGDRAKVPVLEHLLKVMSVHGVIRTDSRGLATPGSHSHAPINFWPFDTRGKGRAIKRGERPRMKKGISTPSS